MKSRYKNISNGYIGIQCSESTLNSQYYGRLLEELHNSPTYLANFIIFPQKIPRADFFAELYSLETPDFRNRFDKIIKFIDDNYINAIEALNQKNSVENIRTFVNWAALLSRYGRFAIIKNHIPVNYSGNHSLEIALIHESNNIEILLSNDEDVTVDGLLQLAHIYMDDDNTTDREKILLLNQIIVNFYRHQKKSSQQHEILLLANRLLQHIQKFTDTSFLGIYYASIVYRGLAMVHEFKHHRQSEFLAIAEKLARELQGGNELEKLVRADNLNTCLQTMSKWSFFKKDIPKAENYLLEMIAIDPTDSTPYSELGFFYIKTESYDLAAKQFKKAVELGPPGAGMNSYFYAKCLEKLGKEKDAITCFYEAAELDQQAISPWLDLLNYYANNNIADKTLEIAQHIYQTPVLMEQLEQDEVIIIQNFIK